MLGQFLLSYAFNVLDPHECRLLIVTSSPSETDALNDFLRRHLTDSQMAKLDLSITDLPYISQKLDPLSEWEVDDLPKDTGFHKGKFGTLYICLKKIFAAWFSYEVLGSRFTMVTDSEAYIWKPISIRELFLHHERNPTVWFSDSEFPRWSTKRSEGYNRTILRPPKKVPELSKVHINFCSTIVWSGYQTFQLGEEYLAKQWPQMRKAFMLGAAPPSARWTGPHDWEFWRYASQGKMPAPNADLMDYGGYFYPRNIFHQWRTKVEERWNLGLVDAILTATELWPDGCRHDAFWFEVSWHTYLYVHHRPLYTFRNSTAFFERHFPPSLFEHSTRVRQMGLPSNSGWMLLWWYIDDVTFPYFEELYRQEPHLSHFRMDWRGNGFARGTRDLNCSGLKLIRAVAGSAAAFQVHSSAPNYLFDPRDKRGNCERFLPNKSLPWLKHTITSR